MGREKNNKIKSIYGEKSSPQDNKLKWPLWKMKLSGTLGAYESPVCSTEFCIKRKKAWKHTNKDSHTQPCTVHTHTHPPLSFSLSLSLSLSLTHMLIKTHTHTCVCSHKNTHKLTPKLAEVDKRECRSVWGCRITLSVPHTMPSAAPNQTSALYPPHQKMFYHKWQLATKQGNNLISVKSYTSH